jgi:uncharacterized NAD(P)/FAD-binding protein YdhS
MKTYEESQAWWNEHKHKTFDEIRKDLMELEKEDIIDILENHYGDVIHDWREALHASRLKVKRLEGVEQQNRIYKSKLIANGLIECHETVK